MTRSVARFRLLIIWSTCAVLLHSPGVFAQTKPDNTKVNKADRAPSQPTADQQKNNTSDLDMTQTIRRAIMADKSLSTYAHNVKIITQNGKVTLRGPVRTDAEKASVQAKAADVAGAPNVTNEVSVAPTKSTTKKPVS
jgi:hyperosmotically inducible protein